MKNECMNSDNDNANSNKDGSVKKNDSNSNNSTGQRRCSNQKETKFLEKLGLTNATINFGGGSVMNIHETERTSQNIPKSTSITNYKLLFLCYHADTIYV